jgi:hypothetical protein
VPGAVNEHVRGHGRGVIALPILVCGKRYTRQKGMDQRRRIAGYSGRPLRVE